MTRELFMREILPILIGYRSAHNKEQGCDSVPCANCIVAQRVIDTYPKVKGGRKTSPVIRSLQGRPCPDCGSGIGVPCLSPNGRYRTWNNSHTNRFEDLRAK